MTPEQRRERGEKCARLMQDATFTEVSRAVDAHYREAMFRTELAETEKRELLYAEYKGYLRMMQQLKSWAGDGVIAARELDAADKRAKR